MVEYVTLMQEAADEVKQGEEGTPVSRAQGAWAACQQLKHAITADALTVDDFFPKKEEKK